MRPDKISIKRKKNFNLKYQKNKFLLFVDEDRRLDSDLPLDTCISELIKKFIRTEVFKKLSFNKSISLHNPLTLEPNSMLIVKVKNFVSNKELFDFGKIINSFKEGNSVSIIWSIDKPITSIARTIQLRSYVFDKLKSGSNRRKDSAETIFFVDTLKDGSRPVFETRYPATFRMGVSKEMDKVLFASDLVAGFENKYYAQKLWKWSLGVEWRQVPMVPMRLGFAWGGSGNQELGMGFGVKKGPIMFDFGFAFRNGIWLNTMKGFNFSIGATFIGREKNIESENNDLKGPLPKK